MALKGEKGVWVTSGRETLGLLGSLVVEEVGEEAEDDRSPDGKGEDEALGVVEGLGVHEVRQQ